MPLVGVAVPRARHQAGLDDLGHVGLEREVDEVGGQPVDHRGGLGARGPEGRGDRDARAGLRLGEGGGQGGVGGLGRGVGHQVGGAARGAPAGRAVKASPQRARAPMAVLRPMRTGGRGASGRGWSARGFCACGQLNTPGLLKPSRLVRNGLDQLSRANPLVRAPSGGGGPGAAARCSVVGGREQPEGGLAVLPGLQHGPVGAGHQVLERGALAALAGRPAAADLHRGADELARGRCAEVLPDAVRSRRRARTPPDAAVSTRNCVPPIRASTSFLRKVTDRARATACSAASPAW